MGYYTGSMAAVPNANKAKYIEHVKESWSLLRDRGAIRMVESWGVDVPQGKVNDLYGAVKAGKDEAVVFAWIEWPDRATADAAWSSLQSDAAVKDMPPMPFDGGRMIFGGFEPILEEGEEVAAGYIQGFVLAVPDKNKPAYTQMAEQAWEGAFKPNGCLALVEAWGVDIARGQRTDFYRACQAEEGEVPVFSWAAWSDKAACDAAAKAMEASMEGQEYPQMPFDGMRMMWGGFEKIFDSAQTR